MTVNGERALRPSSAMSALTPKADPDRRIPAPGAAWLLYAKGPCNHNARSQWRAARRELDDSRRFATLARAAICGVEGHLRYAAFVDASGRKGQVGADAVAKPFLARSAIRHRAWPDHLADPLRRCSIPDRFRFRRSRTVDKDE